jgi:hypothetical protein
VKFLSADCKLELELVGYQFGVPEKDRHDRNWLQVRIEAMHDGARWKATNPVLLTWEVAELAQWLEDVAAGKLVEDSPDFIEPNLRFEFLEVPPRLRVYFELEFRPNWMRAEGAPMDDFWCEFPMEPDQLRVAAASLRAQLARFPQR